MASFDKSLVRTGIVHFGVGRFHRAHEALYLDEILKNGDLNWGVCGVFMLPSDKFVYEKMVEQNGVYTLIERDLNGVCTKQVHSIVEMLNGHLDPDSVFQKLLTPEVKIVTFTVTEAGYFFVPSSKTLDFSHSCIQHDIACPDKPKSLYGYLARGLYMRREKGMKPFTVQSCDNIQGNGDLVHALLIEFCSRAYPDLVNWIENNVAFPNSMVDRITPAPSAEELTYVQEQLNSTDCVPVTCESYRQWVIEDNYCNCRPDWASVGVQLVLSVKPYEKIKVRLLNAGHSALGYAGHLAGFACIDEVASDDTFQTYLMRFFSEVSNTLDPVAGVDLSTYQRTLLSRFSNPAIKDQILRICKDGSAKIPGFVLPTLRELIALSSAHTCVAFVIASYMAFLQACVADSALLDDPERDRLLALMTACNGSAVMFLADVGLFCEVGENVELVGTVQKMFDSIVANGVVAAMKVICLE
jgi:mannitol 2-dehydrogenase